MITHVIVNAADSNPALDPLTRTRSWGMLPVLGKPLLAHVMQQYYQAGIRRFSLIVGERDGAVVQWVNERWHKDSTVDFVPQGHGRGPAAALLAAEHTINDEPFILTSCDNLVSEQHVNELALYFSKHPRDAAALSIYYAEETRPSEAGVLLDPRGYVMYISDTALAAHQDQRIALPITAFQPQILAFARQSPVDGHTGERTLAYAIQRMIDSGTLVGGVVAKWRHKLHTIEDLRIANLHQLKASNARVKLSPIPTSARLTSPFFVDTGVSIGHSVSIGPNVFIEEGSVIGAGSHLKECVILGAHIGPNQMINGELIHEDRT